MWRSSSASALGAEGRRFKSCHPDNRDTPYIRRTRVETSVEQLNPTRVKLTVGSPSRSSGEFDKAYATLAQQVRIPGFRPGKAPAS